MFLIQYVARAPPLLQRPCLILPSHPTPLTNPHLPSKCPADPPGGCQGLHKAPLQAVANSSAGLFQAQEEEGRQLGLWVVSSHRERWLRGDRKSWHGQTHS